MNEAYGNDLKGVRGCVKRAPTQLLNQLAFRSDAVKRRPFYIILPTQVISSHNKRGHQGPLH